MRQELMLRSIIVGQVILIGIWFAAHTQLEATLPLFLQRYLELKRELDAEGGQDALFWFALFGGVLSLVSLVGVFLLKRWGRITFTLGVAYYVVLSFFDDPQVSTAFESGIFGIILLGDGLILGLIWFSPLSRWFIPAKAQARQAPEVPLSS